ncbi:MAG: DUF7557 family protein [Nitrososphaeraceae archaeon]
MNTPSILIKTLKISEETHRRLSKVGAFGDTFEDIINKLLDFYEAKSKK